MSISSKPTALREEESRREEDKCEGSCGDMEAKIWKVSGCGMRGRGEGGIWVVRSRVGSRETGQWLCPS